MAPVLCPAGAKRIANENVLGNAKALVKVVDLTLPFHYREQPAVRL